MDALHARTDGSSPAVTLPLVRGQNRAGAAMPYCYGLAVCLLWGFALDVPTANDVLLEWGERRDNVNSHGGYYPWSSSQIGHKINDACNAAYGGICGDKLSDYQLVKLQEQEDQIATLIKGGE